jgi:hypothetical protein
MRRSAGSGFNRARAAFGSLALVFALLACGAASARAQQPLTRADSADVLMGTAERLHAQGSEQLAEALARMVERRYAETPAAARATVLLASLSEVEASRSGRVGLVAFTTIYGAWLGVAVPVMLEADSSELFGLGLLTGAPLGFFAGRAFAKDRSISAGDAGTIAWSTLWGTWQGLGWQIVGEMGEDCEQIADDVISCSDGVTTMFGMMVAGGLVGMGASALVANATDIGGGTGTMIAWGSLWGTGAGLVTTVLFDLNGEDEPLTAALLAGDLGFAAMAVLAPRWRMSTGRAWLINAAGIMGGAIGGGLDLLILPDDEDVAVLIPTIGSALGLYIGAHLTRDMDEGRIRQGRLHDANDAPGALLRLRDGDWRVALPQPTPALLRTHARETEVGARVTLLDARF